MSERAVFDAKANDTPQAESPVIEASASISEIQFEAATREEASNMVSDAFRTGSNTKFIDGLAELVTDPLIPVESGERRPIRPVLLSVSVGIILILAIILYFFFKY